MVWCGVVGCLVGWLVQCGYGVVRVWWGAVPLVGWCGAVRVPCGAVAEGYGVVGWLVSWLVGWFVGLLVCCLVGWLFGWLDGWMDGCMRCGVVG